MLYIPVIMLIGTTMEIIILGIILPQIIIRVEINFQIGLALMALM